MGNQQTLINEDAYKGILDPKIAIKDQLQSQGTKRHQYLKLIQLWKLKSKKPFTFFSKVTHSYSTLLFQTYAVQQNDYNLIQNIKNRRAINHPNLIKYFGTSLNDQYKFCTTAQEITSFFEFYCFKQSLQQIIDYHKQNLSNIKESKIRKILIQLVSVGNYLKKRNKYHSDYRPENIFFNSNNDIKVLENGLLNEIQSGYSLALGYNEQALLSPQALELCSQKILTPEYDKQKGDVFSIGMTILECMTLEPSQEYYNYETGLIEMNRVLARLHKCSEDNYSDLLISTVEKMLNESEEQRPSFGDLNVQLENQEEDVDTKQLTKQSVENKQNINLNNISMNSLNNGSQVRRIIPQQMIYKRVINQSPLKQSFATPIKNYNSNQNSQVKVMKQLNKYQQTVPRQGKLFYEGKMLDTSIVQPTLQKYRQSPQRVVSRGQQQQPQIMHQRSVTVLQQRHNNMNYNQLDHLNRRVQDALEKSRQAIKQYAVK